MSRSLRVLVWCAVLIEVAIPAQAQIVGGCVRGRAVSSLPTPCGVSDSVTLTSGSTGLYFTIDGSTWIKLALTADVVPVTRTVNGHELSADVTVTASDVGAEVPVTFSTGLTRTVDTVTVNTSQNIATLSNLTGNGFVKTSGGTGALSIDTATYLTSVTAHNLLSATHGDTLADTVVRGDLLYGNATPKWARLAKPLVLSSLSHDGTDVSWVTANGTGNPARTTNVAFVTPTLGAASATSVTLTGTPGITQQRPNDNSTQILIQSTVPPEGRTYEAPFMWLQGGSTFLSEFDPVMYFGYNSNRAIATEPSMTFVIEGNYKTSASTRTVEAYWEFFSSARTNLRPIFFTTYKDDIAHTTLDFLSDSITFKKADGTLRGQIGNNGFQAGNSYLATSGQLTVNASGGGGAVANITNSDAGAFVPISTEYASGLTDGQQGYSYFGVNTGNYNRFYKAFNRVGNNSTSNNVVYGFAGAGVDLLKLVGAGRVGILQSSPTAKLHIGAGSATASTAPLKFTSGTVNTTAETGAMEYDGTNLFFVRTGTTRENIITTPTVNTVSPTSPDRTITVNINGTTYYIAAKTTND